MEGCEIVFERLIRAHMRFLTARNKKHRFEKEHAAILRKSERRLRRLMTRRVDLAKYAHPLLDRICDQLCKPWREARRRREELERAESCLCFFVDYAGKTIDAQKSTFVAEWSSLPFSSSLPPLIPRRKPAVQDILSPQDGGLVELHSYDDDDGHYWLEIFMLRLNEGDMRTQHARILHATDVMRSFFAEKASDTSIKAMAVLLNPFAVATMDKKRRILRPAIAGSQLLHEDGDAEVDMACCTMLLLPLRDPLWCSDRLAVVPRWNPRLASKLSMIHESGVDTCSLPLDHFNSLTVALPRETPSSGRVHLLWTRNDAVFHRDVEQCPHALERFWNTERTPSASKRIHLFKLAPICQDGKVTLTCIQDSLDALLYAVL